MKIQISALISNMAGSLGGSSVRRSRYGLVLQTKANQTKKINNDISVAKSRFSRLASVWSSFNDAQKNEWQFYANANPVFDKFGNEIILTGYAFYIRANQLTRFWVRNVVLTDSFVLVPAINIDLFLVSVTSSQVEISVNIDNAGSDFIVTSCIVPVSSEFTPVFRKKASVFKDIVIINSEAYIYYQANELPYSRHKKYKCLINISHKNGWVSPQFVMYFGLP